MFNDRFGLTDAVLAGQKTMTRQLVKLPDDSMIASYIWNPVMGIDDKGKVHFTVDCIDFKQRDIYPKYQPGEVVAVAQPYMSDNVLDYLAYDKNGKKRADGFENHRFALSSPGYKDKRFVRADLMPHRIKITNIKMERLRDISDGDCSKEGIVPFTWRQWLEQDINDFGPQKYKDWNVWTLPKFIDGLSDSWGESDPDEYMAESPQVAFAVLIFKLMSRKVWEQNPWVFAYEFELIK